MKVFNKFVESKKEPSNKNDIWFDGSVFRMYKEGEWQAFTLPVNTVDRVLDALDGIDLFKIVPSLPEVGEANTIYLVYSFGNTNDSFIEYIYTENGWEKIGNIDPTFFDDYVNTTQFSELEEEVHALKASRTSGIEEFDMLLDPYEWHGDYEVDCSLVIPTFYRNNDFVLIFKEPFINSNDIDDSLEYSNSNTLLIKEGNTIIKSFEGELFYITIKSVSVEDTDNGEQLSVLINIKTDGMMMLSDVISSISSGKIIKLNDIYIPDTIARKSDLEDIGGAVSHEDIYIIEDITAQDIEVYVGGQLRIDSRGLSEAIDSNKRVYIKYSNNAGAGIIPCSAYKDDVYYIAFSLGSSLYGFDIDADSQYIDENYIFHIDIQEKLESGKNIKTINGQSILGEGNLKIEGLSSAIPDWNENNPSDASYIKNRTHYKVEDISYGTSIGYGDSYYNDDDTPITPNRIRVRSEEGFVSDWISVYDGYGEYFEELYLYNEYGDIQDTYSGDITVDMYTSGVELSMGTANYYVDLDYSTIKKLSEEFIPDTIARKSDLEGGSINEEIQNQLDEHTVYIEDLQNMKIDKENDDYYPNMSVGVADNLSGVDVIDSEFTTRQSGGGAILDGTARIEAIKGNSVVWNQLARSPLFDDSEESWYYSKDFVSATLLDNGEIYAKGKGVHGVGSDTISPRVPLVSGHAYLYRFDIKKNISETIGVYLGDVWYNPSGGVPIAADTWYHVEKVATPTTNLERGLWIYPWNNTTLTDCEAWIKNVVVYDLTQMFGAGNEPTTVEEFDKRMPIGVDMSLYNEGQMINLNPSGIESYSADEEPIERFQDLSLIGALFPDGMKSVGEFHDEIRYNKETQKWEKITRIGEVDLGSLNWSYASDIGYFYSSPSEDIGGGNTFKDTNQQVVLINSEDFTGLHWSAFTNNYVDPRNNAISLYYTPDYDAVRANICCGAYTDVASFKEYLQGKKAYFVLNDPIVEELDFYGNLDYEVWNGGTEELVADNPCSALKADIVYGFNAYGKIKELEGRIDNLGTGGGGTGGSTITVDPALSDTSTNPVQNKVINEKLTELSAEVGKKVGADFVNNAIATAITNELTADF